VLAEKSRGRPGWVPWAVVVTLVLVVVATALFRHRANLKWARESVARVEALAQGHRYFQAYDLAMGVREFLPDDPTVARLAPEISDALSVLTEPAGRASLPDAFLARRIGQIPSAPACRHYADQQPSDRARALSHGYRER